MDAKDQLIESYISWMKQNDYADSTIKFHRQTLNIYFDYLANNRLSIEQGFTFRTLDLGPRLKYYIYQNILYIFIKLFYL
jgi:hypothetical protein